jgi:hypothetical protein
MFASTVGHEDERHLTVLESTEGIDCTRNGFGAAEEDSIDIEAECNVRGVVASGEI